MKCAKRVAAGVGAVMAAVRRSYLVLAAVVALGLGLGARAQLPVTDGLIVWLKADAVNTNDAVNQVRLSGGEIYVKQWVDQSGGNRHAANTTENDQPRYVAAGLNGLPVLRFAQDSEDNGDRLYLGDLSASFPTAGSVFAVAAPDNDGRYNVFGNRSSGDERWVANTWNESRPGSFRNARSGNASFTFSDWPTNGAHVYALESSSAAFRMLIDGAEIGSDTGDYHNGNGSNWAIANRGYATGGQQLRGDIPELILFNRILTAEEAGRVGSYLVSKYGVTGTAYSLVVPDTPSNLTATAAAGSVNLSWAAAALATRYVVKRASASGGPYTDIGTAAAPAYSDSTSAVGVTNYYVVAAVNSVGESALSNETPGARFIATGNAILSMQFGALGFATVAGTNIVKNVPIGTAVTALAPTYTVSLLAAQDPDFPSGSARDFTAPQAYTIVSEDGVTNAYLVTVIPTAATTYDFNSGLQGWAKLWPSAAALWENGALGAGGDTGETRFGRSPEFYLNNLGDLTFQLRGGQSPLAAPYVLPSAIPELAISNGGFAGVALRDVAGDSYVLSRRRNGSADAWQTGSFSAVELLPYVNNGKTYTLDYIDYNKGSWGWTYMDNVSIPATLAMPLLTSLTLPPFDPASIIGTNVTLRVSFGTDLSALAPAYTFTPATPFAMGLPASGTPQDFSAGPVTYTLVSADLSMTNTYAVTVVVLPDPATALVGHWVSFAENLTDHSGYTPAGTHNGAAVGNAGGLAYSPDVPPGFAGCSLDLTAGGVGVRITNSTTNEVGYANTFDEGVSNQLTVAFWAKGFPAQWSPWVAKRGDAVGGVGMGWQIRRMDQQPFAGFTLRGVDGEDGFGSAINVSNSPAVWRHFAGVWDQAAGTRTFYVDGVLSHVLYNTPSQTMRLAPGQALTLGARADGGTGYHAFFPGLLYDVRIYKQVLFSNQVQVVRTTPTVPQSPEAKMTTFGTPNWPAKIPASGGGTVTWVFPFGGDLSALAPTFTVSTGATCDRLSGVTNDFNQAQVYRVVSSDLLVTNVYTVKAATGFNFNDGTLQGWRNRVWDLSANGGAGGWVDLEPNVTTLPLTINGGVLQPPSLSNQLYGVVGGVVYPVGGAAVVNPFDYHANTMWLRSPEFYLNKSGDLTVQLAQGVTRTPTNPSSELGVPLAAATDGGWMGVILRRVSDNAFVLVKPKTQGPNATYYTVTFTQAELATFSGLEPFTLEVINANRGSWGWLTLDNVAIPGNSSPAFSRGTLIYLK